MTTITIERTILDRLIEAWDSTVLPTHRDGMMQERMEDLRAELAKPTRCALCGYQHGHQIGCANNPVDIALSEQAASAELAKKINSEAHCAESSVDYWQQRGYLGRPDEWREACRLFRVRCSPEDINSMAKLRAYIEDGLLIVSRPISKTPTPAQHDAPETLALKAERDATMKDAERLDYLQKHARCDPKMDGKHVWWPTTFNQAQNLRGETLREAIDAAIAKAEGDAIKKGG